MNAIPQLLGTLTIGQAPRADITPILRAVLPEGTQLMQAGVLDGLSKEQIAADYAPIPDVIAIARQYEAYLKGGGKKETRGAHGPLTKEI